MEQKSSKSKEITESRCMLLTPLYARPGTICLTNQEIIFFDDIYRKQDSHESLFFFQIKDYSKKLMYKSYPLQQVKEI
jgi:hypothetical protein